MGALQATLSGSEYFKGPRAFVVPARAVGLYTITFKPEWLCEDTAELSLDCPALKGFGQPPMQFSFKGIGLEPLAEDHVVITCQARDRIEHGFVVKNPSTCPCCVMCAVVVRASATVFFASASAAVLWCEHVIVECVS